MIRQIRDQTFLTLQSMINLNCPPKYSFDYFQNIEPTFFQVEQLSKSQNAEEWVEIEKIAYFKLYQARHISQTQPLSAYSHQLLYFGNDSFSLKNSLATRFGLRELEN